MTLEIEIREAKPWHCGAALRRMRQEHITVLKQIGCELHQDLAAMLRKSFDARAGFINGRLAGLWGVDGGLSCNTGFVWLVLTEEAALHPLAVVKTAKAELRRMLETYTELTAAIMAPDEPSLRLALALGFRSGTVRASRAETMRHLRESDEVRLPVGNTFVIPVACHPASH